MRYTIRYLKIAKDDLKEIRSYLSQFYPSTTQGFLSSLRKQAGLLKSTPLMCEKYRDDTFYRKMVIGDYSVFYHVDETKQVVEIHHILHGSRDIKQYIK